MISDQRLMVRVKKKITNERLIPVQFTLVKKKVAIQTMMKGIIKETIKDIKDNVSDKLNYKKMDSSH